MNGVRTADDIGLANLTTAPVRTFEEGNSSPCGHHREEEPSRKFFIAGPRKEY